MLKKTENKDYFGELEGKSDVVFRISDTDIFKNKGTFSRNLSGFVFSNTPLGVKL